MKDISALLTNLCSYLLGDSADDDKPRCPVEILPSIGLQRLTWEVVDQDGQLLALLDLGHPASADAVNATAQSGQTAIALSDCTNASTNAPQEPGIKGAIKGGLAKGKRKICAAVRRGGHRRSALRISQRVELERINDGRESQQTMNELAACTADHLHAVWTIYVEHLAARWPGSGTHAAAIATGPGQYLYESAVFSKLTARQKKLVESLINAAFNGVDPRKEHLLSGGKVARIKVLSCPHWVKVPLVAVGIHEDCRMVSLSAREAEVVHWIVKGWSFKEISAEMGISASTAATLCYRAYEKLGVVNRKQLRNLIEPQ